MLHMGNYLTAIINCDFAKIEPIEVALCLQQTRLGGFNFLFGKILHTVIIKKETKQAGSYLIHYLFS